MLGGEAPSLLEKVVPKRPWREALDPSLLQSSHFAAATASAERAELHERQRELVGDRFAGVLMEFLLPVPTGTLPRLEHELARPVTAPE